MKKILDSLFILLLMIFGINKVNAASTCSYEDQVKLNNISANVKANYEEKQLELNKDDYILPEELTEEEKNNYKIYEDYLQVSLLNLSKDIYIELSDNQTNKVIKVENVEGIYNLDWYNIDLITTFTIKIYASDNTGCSGELYRTFYLTLPRINDFNSYDICKTNSDYYLCQKYVTFEKTDYTSFVNKINDYTDKENKEINEENDKNIFQKIGDFLKEHKTASIITGVSLVVIIGGITFVIIKKRRVFK